MAYTLEQFCEDKRLPLDWVVKKFALRDGEDTLRYKDDNPGRWKKGEEFKIKGIFFPYNDGNGTQHRIRVSRAGKKRFLWSSDYKRQMLYGLNVPPPDGADTKTIVLVEGESCCITGRMLGLSTLGIAGAPYGWQDRFKNLAPFQNAERIYVVQERKRDDLKPEDIDAGAELVRRVAASFPGKVYAIRLDTNTNIKDLSDLWLESCKLTALCPEYEFVELWNKARACADEKTTEAELDIEDSLPEFPKFTGTLVELAEALCPDLPFCNKFMVGAALVGGAISGKIYLRDLLHIDPRFYAILIAEKGAGKGGSWLGKL